MIVTSIVMLALLAGALGFMAYSVKGRIELLAALNKPAPRLDNIWKRVDAVIVYALGQKRMFKETVAGLMHALIFWGFLILLIRSISLIGAAFTEDMHWSLFFFWEPLEHWYTLLKDITELWVIAMVLFAYYRRWVIRPERVHQSRDAEFILLMILSLMVTDFLMDGAKFLAAVPGAEGVDPAYAAKVASEAAWAPIGRLVGAMYATIGLTYGSTSVAVFHVFFWLHVGILFFFMNYLPYSKHMHVLTSLPNVFLRNLKPGYPLEHLGDLEAEFEKEEPTVGVGKLEDLSWKQGLDLYTCTECGRCTVNCPADLTGKPLKPRQFTEDLRNFLYGERERLLENRKRLQAWEAAKKAKPDEDIAKPELLTTDKDIVEQVGYDVVWSCTTCRSCEENCPVMIEYVDKMVDLRRNMTMMASNFPQELNGVFRNLENKSNPWGLPTGERADWTEGLDIPIMAELSDAQRAELDLLFFVGCAGSYDMRSQKVAKAIVKILRAAGVKFAILGTEEGCTGDTARRLGNEYLFQMQAMTNIEMFNAYKVTKILTMCPHCLQTIGNEYPDLGGKYEVLHHTQLIADLIDKGAIKLGGDADGKRIVYHDSCYLGRYNEIYDEPRDILHALKGVKVVETERNRENGMCCGAGGGWFWMEEHVGTRMNVLRTEQLLEAKPDQVATACPFCITMIGDGVATKEMDEKVKTLDIAELVAAALVD